MLKLLLFFVLFSQIFSNPTLTFPPTTAPDHECPPHEHPSDPKIAIYETHCYPNGTTYKKLVLPKNGCTCKSGYFRTALGCISNYYCPFQFFCRVNEEIGTGHCDRLCIFGIKGLQCSPKPLTIQPRCLCKEGYARYPPAPYECKSAYRCLY